MSREEIMEEAEKHMYDWGVDVDRFDIPDIFIKGAEWMQKKMIEKACEWLDEHWNDYFSENDDFNGWNMISDFRKAMEE